MTSTTIIFDLIGRDGASAAFRSAGASAEAASAKIAAAGAKIGAVGAKMTKGITLPAVAIAAVSVKMSNDFNSAMTRIQTQAGASADDVQYLSKQVLALGGKVQQTPIQLADALYHLKSVGLDNVDAMKALVQASHLAAVGNADLEETTNAVAGAWRTGIKGAHDFKGAVSTLNAIIGAGNMTMTDLNDAIGTGFLPAAKTFGLSLKDVGSALALMTDEGVPANAAATRLRMSFSLLGAPSAAAAKVLKSIGVNANALGHALRNQGIVGAIGMLKDHLQGLSKVKQSQVLSRAFGGGRSSAAIMTLVNNFDVLKKKETQVSAGMKKFGADVAKQAQTPQAKFKLLVSTLATLSVEIGNVLLPVVIKMATGLKGLVDWFSRLNPNVQKGVGAFAAFLAIAGPVLVIAGSLFSAIAKISAGMEALKAMALGTRIQLAALWVTEKIGAIATKAVAAAQWLLNAAMDANPIGLVIVAVAALAVGMVIAYKKSATFRAIVQAAFHGIQAAASKVAGFFTNQVPAAFNRVKSAASSVLGWVKSHWPLILAVLTGPFGLAVYAIAKNWGKIRDGASAVKQFVTDKFSALVDFFKGLPGKFANASAGMFDGIKNAFRSALDWVIGKWNALSFTIPGVNTHIPGVGKVGGFTISTPDIPMMAKGGIVRRPTLAMIGEAGAEAVMPLSGPNARGLGDTYNITISGALDPIAVGKQVEQVLTRLKNARGGRAMAFQ